MLNSDLSLEMIQSPVFDKRKLKHNETVPSRFRNKAASLENSIKVIKFPDLKPKRNLNNSLLSINKVKNGNMII